MFTKTFTVNAVGDPEAVTTGSNTSRVTIAEDPSVSGWPTSDYNVMAPSSDSTAIRKAAGTMFTFKPSFGQWPPDTIIGYVETVSGSTTFQQVEE